LHDKENVNSYKRGEDYIDIKKDPYNRLKLEEIPKELSTTNTTPEKLNEFIEIMKKPRIKMSRYDRYMERIKQNKKKCEICKKVFSKEEFQTHQLSCKNEPKN
jgi:hypothetical protein